MHAYLLEQHLDFLLRRGLLVDAAQHARDELLQLLAELLLLLFFFLLFLLLTVERLVVALFVLDCGVRAVVRALVERLAVVLAEGVGLVLQLVVAVLLQHEPLEELLQGLWVEVHLALLSIGDSKDTRS